LTFDTLGVTSIAETFSFLSMECADSAAQDPLVDSSVMVSGDGGSSSNDAAAVRGSVMQGYLFVGSSFGDSQFVKLHPTPYIPDEAIAMTLEDSDDAEKAAILANQGTYVEVLETFTNIGPIVDMCLVDLDRQGGQRQLVTCSGAYKDGSLRVVRSGIGMQEQASLEVEGIKGVWSLRPTSSSSNSTAAFDKYLVQSFIGETRILSIEEEELAEIEIDGFSSQESTLYCGNVTDGMLVQVTAHDVRLVACDTFRLVSTYQPAAHQTITLATGTATQLVLAISGGELQYLELVTGGGEGTLLKMVSSCTLDQDIACLSMRPLVDDSTVATRSNSSHSGVIDVEDVQMEVDDGAATGTAGTASSWRSHLVAVAMWTDDTVRLHALPDLQEVTRVTLGSEIQARDILIVKLEALAYLLVGLGDGRLITYNIDMEAPGAAAIATTAHAYGDSDTAVMMAQPPSLRNKRNGILGTHPITFNCFSNADTLCVFAACDRPTVIYSKNGKLLFSVLDVNHTEFTNMAPFHSELFPDCLALCSESSLLIGVIEDIQKVHVQHVPLNQAPRRIAHSARNAIYAVTADHTARTARGEETMSRVLFFDDASFEQIGLFELDRLEQGISITTCTFSNNDNSSSVTANTAAAGGDGIAATTTTTAQSVENNSMTTTAVATATATTTEAGAAGAAAVTEYVVVGTAHVISGELEPSRGRILVFQVSPANRRVYLVTEREVKAAVFCLTAICGRIAAGIGSKVSIFKLMLPEGGGIVGMDVGGAPTGSSTTGVEGIEVGRGGGSSGTTGGSSSSTTIASVSTGGTPELLHECTHSAQIMSLYLKARGNTLIVGDLIRSITMLRYTPPADDTGSGDKPSAAGGGGSSTATAVGTGGGGRSGSSAATTTATTATATATAAGATLKEISRDYNSSYMRAVEILEGPREDLFYGADTSGNLFALRHQVDAVSDEERSKLEGCGEFHLGEYVNAFCPGSLVGQPIDAADTSKSASSSSSGTSGANAASVGGTLGSILSPNYQSITGLKPGAFCGLYGGTNGTIGNIITLSNDAYLFFSIVERVMRKLISPCGTFTHKDFRAFHNDLRSAPQRNMIDGDLVEMCLELDPAQLRDLTRDVNDELNFATNAINVSNAASSATTAAESAGLTGADAAADGGGGGGGGGASTAAGDNKSSSSSSSSSSATVIGPSNGAPAAGTTTGTMLSTLDAQKLQLTTEDILRRVEDIARLH